MEKVLTVVEARRELKISHTKMYELLLSGKVHSFRIGRLRRIRKSALDDFINRQLLEEGFDPNDSEEIKA
ncbi:helix-turn-helix domain-containing protein [Candidatus Lucifugimonas marina]|uniref:Helix-turn-helix domain-containing protein n=1 Tax=Candidatus Lucifugimonas marina TaxID=3038979 RepID=A0AAJ5ZF10_9CHLR|nr:helix-turn-helix domain-containing protein [SAR202 cluster bacterium JH702]MDG0868314.1 helix-turn-helix domain-containing protein [SAR202 cluster bacterium JH639]WFG38909.1 helix-turn-helix domain-containing protein [SAR202 cluster bacterium JH1073]